MSYSATPSRKAAVAAMLVMPLVLAVGACAPDGTEEQIETEMARTEAEEVETAEDLVGTATGSMELVVGGDIETVAGGTASCVIEAATGELRVSLEPRGPSDYRYHLVVPDYDQGTGTYEGTFQVSGAQRAVGPAEVGVDRVEDDEVFQDQLAVAFEATYSGAAGIGQAQGQAICSLPDGGEPL